MRRYDVPDLDAYFHRWSDLHLGYDPRGAFWPRTWLRLTYYAARPLACRGVAPNHVTALGGLISGVVPVLAWRSGGWLLLGAALVVVAGLADSVDGAIAAMTDRATPLGYVLDSMADRISDGCYLLALWLLGAPAWLCVAGGAVTILQEYLRARAGNAGMATMGVATVAERPMRLIVTALAMTGAFALAQNTDAVAGLGAGVWLTLGCAGFVQLSLAVRRTLGPSR